jgi:hypothetical protein
MCVRVRARLCVGSCGSDGALTRTAAARVQSNHSLRALYIADTELGTESCIAIASAMGANSTLEVLDVSNPRLFSRMVRGPFLPCEVVVS